jgi:hypothetical protein
MTPTGNYNCRWGEKVIDVKQKMVEGPLCATRTSKCLYVTIEKMKEDPSILICRNKYQTTLSGFRQKLRS